MSNVSKFKTITYQPGKTQLRMSEDAVVRKGKGKVYTYRGRLRRQLPFLECGVELMVGSMADQSRCLNGTDPDIYWNRIPVSQKEHLQ